MNWLYTLWFGYAWPSLKGNGPEAVIQTVVYAAIGYAVYPPFRNWVHGHVSSLHSKLDDLKSSHKELHDKVDRL